MQSKFLWPFYLLLLTSFICCNDDDSEGPSSEVLPTEATGTYTGQLSYTPENGDLITNEMGTATLNKSVNSYTIDFSDDIPSIENIIFSGSDNFYSTVSTSGITGIVFDNGTLKVGTNIDENLWIFQGVK